MVLLGVVGFKIPDFIMDVVELPEPISLIKVVAIVVVGVVNDVVMEGKVVQEHVKVSSITVVLSRTTGTFEVGEVVGGITEDFKPGLIHFTSDEVFTVVCCKVEDV